MTKGVKICEYEGHVICCTSFGIFVTELDDDEEDADTLDDLKDKIDKFLDSKKRAAKRPPTAIACVSAEGKKTVVTGIHARRGTLLMKPEISHRMFDGLADVFLDCPKANKLIDEHKELNRRLEAVQKELAKLEIVADKERYGSLANEAELERLYKKLDARVASAKKFAGVE